MTSRPSIYFVNPHADVPTYFGAESYAAFGRRPAAQMADLAIATLAALCPPDFDVRLCDQFVEDVDFEIDADYVGITGKVTQFGNMTSIADEFRRRGKVVLIGGPFASLSPEMVRPHCDVLVTGEIEAIAGSLFDDLRAKTFKSHYIGGQPGLDTSPVPRWDLYRNDRAVLGTLQTARGCPFECEFCDVIQYAGRRQRHKSPAHVVRELDVLYDCGYRDIFLADDNLTVYRARARELLTAIADWNARRGHSVRFHSQVSIDTARDASLLDLCAEAGLRSVFIGIETTNPASLQETKKRQNLRVNMLEAVDEFVVRGIQVIGGMIVGFDSDGRDVFQRQLDFAMASPIATFSLGALVAPAATPLHARMERAGRLRPNHAEAAGSPWMTNIVHPTMSEIELLSGVKWLANQLYDPEHFTTRLLSLIRKFGTRAHVVRPAFANPRRSIDADTFEMVSAFRRLGAVEARMWRRIQHALAERPHAGPSAFAAVLQYMQVRHMYDAGHFWVPELAAQPSPAVGSALIAVRPA